MQCTLGALRQVQLDRRPSWRAGQGTVYTLVAGISAAQTGTDRFQFVYDDPKASIVASKGCQRLSEREKEPFLELRRSRARDRITKWSDQTIEVILTANRLSFGDTLRFRPNYDQNRIIKGRIIEGRLYWITLLITQSQMLLDSHYLMARKPPLMCCIAVCRCAMGVVQRDCAEHINALLCASVHPDPGIAVLYPVLVSGSGVTCFARNTHFEMDPVSMGSPFVRPQLCTSLTCAFAIHISPRIVTAHFVLYQQTR
jgi:hypothetical protein